MSKIFGIDISVYQKGIDLNKAKREDVEFAMIRAGYTGSSDGVSKAIDSQFENHYRNAKANGLGVGAYWFSRATTYEKGKSEAEYMYYHCLKGKRFEYPIVMDVEDTKYQAWVSKKEITEAIRGFCETLESFGYYVSVYANLNWINNHMDYSKLREKYDFWIAAWNSKEPSKGKYNYGMWQFGGEINKLRSNKIADFICDQNYAYKNYPEIMIKNNLNGFNQSENKDEISVGDQVQIIGAYASSSNSLFAIHTFKKGSSCYITNIYPNRRYPYQLGTKKGNASSKYTIGFANKLAMVKIDI